MLRGNDLINGNKLIERKDAHHMRP
jgi:hypothetical protein